jgi:Fic-DOC domain mobile mystery protein B
VEPIVDSWQSIPGETPIDPSYLKDRSITNRAELHREEALNIRKAFVKYLAGMPSIRQAPFDYNWLLRLHKEMFGDVWKWAGQLRQIDLNIGVNWLFINEQIYALTQDLPVWAESGVSTLEQATRLHHRAVNIHPFHNGNGRWARLAANIWLKLHKTLIINWPEEVIGQESLIRNQYIQALKKADEGNYDPLFFLHIQFQEKVE